MNQLFNEPTEEKLRTTTPTDSSILHLSEHEPSGCGAEEGLISVDQALEMIINHTQPLSTEIILLKDALNHYLAKPIYAEIELPLFSQSAVDGYAICSDQMIEIRSQFDLIGEIRAGQLVELELKNGQAVRIFTGTKIPKNTCTVARQEIVELDQKNNMIKLTSSLKSHTDIRDAGEEISKGQLLADIGQQLNIGAIAALSMAGIKQVEVYRYPKIAAVITGDEVVDHVADLQSGKIFDANAPLVEAWFKSQMKHVDIMHVEDSAERVSTLLNELKTQYEVIITTGGVSVGDYDFIRPMALKQGFKQIFWKVKQKPGKPMFFAQFKPQTKNSESQTCYLLGLPGNPAAVYIGMQIYASTLIQSLQGQSKALNWFSAELQHDLKMDRRERFLRMHVNVDQTKMKVNSLEKQQSHMLSNLMFANSIVRIPANKTLGEGDTVQGVLI